MRVKAGGEFKTIWEILDALEDEDKAGLALSHLAADIERQKKMVCCSRSVIGCTTLEGGMLSVHDLLVPPFNHKSALEVNTLTTEGGNRRGSRVVHSESTLFCHAHLMLHPVQKAMDAAEEDGNGKKKKKKKKGGRSTVHPEDDAGVHRLSQATHCLSCQETDSPSPRVGANGPNSFSNMSFLF